MFMEKFALYFTNIWINYGAVLRDIIILFSVMDVNSL